MSPPHDVVGPVPSGSDPDDYDRLRRRVLWSMPSGLYVVGTRAGDRRNLMTISWVTQVAMTPKLVGIGVESGAVTHELLDEGGVFALSLLPRSERAVVRRFAKPVTELSFDDDTGTGTMQGEPVHVATTGAPILEARCRGWTARSVTSSRSGATPGSWARSSTAGSRPRRPRGPSTPKGLRRRHPCAWRTPGMNYGG